MLYRIWPPLSIPYFFIWQSNGGWSSRTLRPLRLPPSGLQIRQCPLALSMIEDILTILGTFGAPRRRHPSAPSFPVLRNFFPPSTSQSPFSRNPRSIHHRQTVCDRLRTSNRLRPRTVRPARCPPVVRAVPSGFLSAGISSLLPDLACFRS
jgi:hypothetical protein